MARPNNAPPSSHRMVSTSEKVRDVLPSHCTAVTFAALAVFAVFFAAAGAASCSPEVSMGCSASAVLAFFSAPPPPPTPPSAFSLEHGGADVRIARHLGAREYRACEITAHCCPATGILLYNKLGKSGLDLLGPRQWPGAENSQQARGRPRKIILRLPPGGLNTGLGGMPYGVPHTGLEYNLKTCIPDRLANP